MTIDKLIEEYSLSLQQWKLTRKKEDKERRKVNDYVGKIHNSLKKDFEVFLSELNAHLLDEQKVTGWKLGNYSYIYDNGNFIKLRGIIEIYEIGGKKCVGGRDEYELSVPSFLEKPFKKFISNYKIPVSFWIQNSKWNSEYEK